MKKKDQKNFNYKLWVPIGLVVLLFIVTLGFLLSSGTTVAFLSIEEGEVQVDQGSGWELATDGMKLSEGDNVKTTNGKAVVILYESILVQLDPNTEVKISDLAKEHVKVDQKEGKTWNKFAHISGISTFEVATPTTVATVRGTHFWVADDVGVTEGTIELVMQGQKGILSAGKIAYVKDGKLVSEEFGTEQMAMIIEHKQDVIKHLKMLRQREIEKHHATYTFVKSIRGWSDADVQNYINRMDRGEFDEKELQEKAVVPAKSIDKFVKLTTEIKKEMRQIEELRR